jgi:tRNA pseudouridine55 synthase
MIEPIHGVVVVDKPIGPTSFAIVRDARRATGARKVGHGGTLDPLASGVLPICFGEATKLAQFLLDADKEYEATIRFGAETDTYDVEGTITVRRSVDHLTEDDVRHALAGFAGEQQQIPPMYSALKRAGRPLYEYARAGLTVEREPRTVQIHTLDLRGFESSVPESPDPSEVSALPGAVAGASRPDTGPLARIFLRCSKGTYVRSLAHDLGRVLGTGAHLTALRRTRSGPFGLAGAIAPDALSLSPLPIVSLADALVHLASIVVSGEVALALVQGKKVSWASVPSPPTGLDGRETPVRILAPGGELLAVAHPRASGEFIQTLRVFRSD